MSKESLARATNSTDLSVEAGIIHDADRLAAMATGDVLGGLLLRFRESEQPQWGRRIVLLLARRVRRKLNLGHDISIRVAVCALEEFRYPHCMVCLGARELVGQNLRVECHGCGGTGKQRHTDASRRGRIGTYGGLIDKGVRECHDSMSKALAAYLSNASGRLE